MQVTLEVLKGYCALEAFEINGVPAKYNDFGDKEDADPPREAYCGCGNMHFTPILPTQEVLDKYGINVTEYKEICDMLSKKLSFGACNLCA